MGRADAAFSDYWVLRTPSARPRAWDLRAGTSKRAQALGGPGRGCRAQTPPLPTGRRSGSLHSGSRLAAHPHLLVLFLFLHKYAAIINFKDSLYCRTLGRGDGERRALNEGRGEGVPSTCGTLGEGIQQRRGWEGLPRAWTSPKMRSKGKRAGPALALKTGVRSVPQHRGCG